MCWLNGVAFVGCFFLGFGEAKAMLEYHLRCLVSSHGLYRKVLFGLHLDFFRFRFSDTNFGVDLS